MHPLASRRMCSPDIRPARCPGRPFARYRNALGRWRRRQQVRLLGSARHLPLRLAVSVQPSQIGSRERVTGSPPFLLIGSGKVLPPPDQADLAEEGLIAEPGADGAP